MTQMVSNFVMAMDANGCRFTLTRPGPGWVDAMFLAANVAETYTVPADVYFILFSPTANFYARYNGTAAIPTTEVSNGTGAELNPGAWHVKPTETISFIAPTACIITLACYKSVSDTV